MIYINYFLLFLLIANSLLGLKNDFDRLKNRDCQYHLEISPPQTESNEDGLSSTINIFIKETLYKKGKNMQIEILDSNSFTSQFKLEKKEFDLKISDDFCFTQYNYEFLNNLLIYDKIEFELTKNKMNFSDNKSFFFKIKNIPCELDLPLISSKPDFFKEMKNETTNHYLEFDDIREKHSSFLIYLSFFFELTTLNKIHLNIDKNEFKEKLKENEVFFKKFSSFDDIKKDIFD